MMICLELMLALFIALSRSIEQREELNFAPIFIFDWRFVFIIFYSFEASLEL